MTGPAGAPAVTRGEGNRGRTEEGAVSELLSLDAEVKGTIDVLIVDDEHTLRDSVASVLRVDGYKVTVSGRGEEARDLLQRRAFDIVLLDLYMSQVPGMDLLTTCLEKHAESVVIVMTGNPSVASSLEALRAGAWDYLPKPFSAEHLQVLIGRAAHAVIVGRESRQLRTALARQHGHSEKVTVLGVSAPFRHAIELARRVAATDASVFITGESGTGKELFAQFIHSHSRRSSRELVAVNCAALPEPLLESEMFGHVKGSFTGAIRDKPGLLETANGGTLFLDELTEMSQPIQAKLLRVIQDGVVRRVGSNTTDAVVTVRFIAATNRDPHQALEDGALRQDLYYRLRVVPIRIPSLRERREDIPILAQHFLAYYWNRHRNRRSAVPRLTRAAVQALQNRAWPGNVRELQNVIEHAVVLLEPGTDVQPQDLPMLDEGMAAPTAGGAPGTVPIPPAVPVDVGESGYHETRERLIAEFERDYLVRLVDHAAGNMSRAAKIAGVDRTTLYRLMDKHGLHRDTILTAKSG